MEKIRLQKFLSECGILSRRAAEAAISAGEVTVNALPAQLGDKVDPERDTVAYRGRPVRAPKKEKHTYVMLNKPRGYITSMTDPEGRKCVPELLTGLHTRVYPVGRLDRVSEGLLLLTDDGELTNRLTHPRHSLPKHYRVKVSGHPSEEQMRILTSPMELDGYRLLPVEVTATESGEDTVLHFSLHEGRNRQIRRMCEVAGITVRRLTRVAIGKLKLDGLAVGHWRYLTDDEVDYLYKNTEKK